MENLNNIKELRKEYEKLQTKINLLESAAEWDYKNMNCFREKLNDKKKENEKLNEVIESLHRQVKFHKAQSTEHFNNLQTKEQELYNLEIEHKELKADLRFEIRQNRK